MPDGVEKTRHQPSGKTSAQMTIMAGQSSPLTLRKPKLEQRERYTSYNKKIVLCTDSHGRGLPDELSKLDKSIKLMNFIIPGAKVETLSRVTCEAQGDIRSFDPDVIFVHCGHNNVAAHHIKNKVPTGCRDMIRATAGLVQQLQGYVPSARIITSTMFPRKPKGYFTTTKTLQYNRIVLRMGRWMRGFPFYLERVFVRSLWRTIKPAIANDAMLSNYDGLHLSRMGKIEVAKAWMLQINSKPDKGPWQQSKDLYQDNDSTMQVNQC